MGKFDHSPNNHLFFFSRTYAGLEELKSITSSFLTQIVSFFVVLKFRNHKPLENIIGHAGQRRD